MLTFQIYIDIKVKTLYVTLPEVTAASAAMANTGSSWGLRAGETHKQASTNATAVRPSLVNIVRIGTIRFLSSN